MCLHALWIYLLEYYSFIFLSFLKFCFIILYMEVLVQILKLFGFSGVTVDKNPLVLYAGGVLVLTLLALFAFFSLLFSFIVIILGYNQNILNYLGVLGTRRVYSKWLNRFVNLSRAINLYYILVECFIFSSIMFTLISSSYKILSFYLCRRNVLLLTII